MTLSRGLDLALPGRRQSWRAAALASAITWGLIALVRPELLTLGAVDFQQDHALLSIDIAISRAYCDSPSKISTLIRVPYEARDHAALRSSSVRSVLLDRGATMDRFCRSVGSPIINNENALMWIESMMFRLAPDLSLDRLAIWLHRLHLAGIAVLGLVSMRLGAGMVVPMSTVFVALVVLDRLDALAITAYPLDFVWLLVNASMSALIASGGPSRRGRLVVVVALMVGAFAGFGGNLRTSHWPIYAALPVLSMAWAERQTAPVRVLVPRLTAVLVAFVLGYSGFQQFAITRHLPGGMAESAHHTTWHSTVIGLAIPANELSRREGIEWSDDSALRLARRIDPGVQYISTDYERVLKGYYFDLWRRDRSAMVAVYLLKLRTAGSQMVDVLRGSSGADAGWMWWTLRPADALPNGLFVLATYILIAVAGAVVARSGRASGWLLLSLSATAVVVHLESVAITTLYVAHYHAYLAFSILSASLAAPVVALAAVRRVMADGRMSMP